MEASKPRSTLQTHSESGDRIRRPSNSFLLFRSHYAHETGKNNGPATKDKVAKDSKGAAEAWKSMSLEDKAHWKALAEQEKRDHKEKYPHYQYRRRPSKPKAAHSVDVSNESGPSIPSPRVISKR